MSWSVSLTGTREEVLKESRKQFKTINYLKGEENILKELSRKLIRKGLLSQPELVNVKLQANGHASQVGENIYQTVNINVTPVY